MSSLMGTEQITLGLEKELQCQVDTLIEDLHALKKRIERIKRMQNLYMTSGVEQLMSSRRLTRRTLKECVLSLTT